jgi:hypothetical protein
MNIIGPIAVSIPLFVTLLVCAVARREGTRLPGARLMVLAVATVAAIIALRFIAFPGFVPILSIAMFILFAIPVTRSLEKDAIEHVPEEEVRTAGLTPRSVHDSIPIWLRSAMLMAEACALLWVAMRAAAGHPILFTAVFAGAAIVFFGLYESWMRDEVFSVRAKSNADRTSRVRAVFAAQSLLTLSFLLMAALSAGPWPGLLPLAIVAAIVGSTGCAFALSTGIQQRYLQAWTAEREL